MKLMFQLANEIVVVKIENQTALFSNSQTNFQQFVPIDNLQLSVEGILKEFPELKDLSAEEIKKEGIKRFKEHLGKLKTDEKIKEYMINEMKSQGFVLKGGENE